MTADTIATLINAYFRLDPVVQINGSELCRALLSKKYKPFRDEMLYVVRSSVTPLHVAIFMDQFKPKGSTSKCWCFYATTPGQAPPITETPWYVNLDNGQSILRSLSTRGAHGLAQQRNELLEIPQISKRKLPLLPSNARKRKSPPPPPAPDIGAGPLPTESPHSEHQLHLASNQVREKENWWTSIEAHNLFCPLDRENTAIEAVNNQIEQLQSALGNWDDDNSLLNVVDTENLSAVKIIEEMTSYQKQALRIRMCLITFALSVAQAAEIEKKIVHWKQCCEEASIAAKRMGFPIGKHEKTIRNWYAKYRVKRQFSIPSSPKLTLPLFLQQNDDVSTQLRDYARNNLATLSVEMVSEFIHETIQNLFVHCLPMDETPWFQVRPKNQELFC